MKTISLIIVFLFQCSILFSQNRALKLNLANTVIGLPTIQFESVLKNKICYQLGFARFKRQDINNYFPSISINNRPYSPNVRKGLFVLDVRYYLSKKAMSGFYFAPHGYSYIPTYKNFGIGGNIGYQKLFKRHFLINLGGGISYEFQSNFKSFETNVPRIIVSVGYSW